MANLSSSHKAKKLCRAQRLSKPAEYKQIYKHGKRGRNALFIFHMTRPGIPAARLGVTVSKKVSKKAVTRNRIKRQVKEFYRNHCQLLSGVDLVITATYQCGEASNQQIQESLQNLWKKILQSQLCGS